jgi:DNA-binding XRE family transcriptional regulator
MQASCMLPSLPFVKADLGQAIRRLRSQTTDYSQDELGRAVGRHRTYIGLLERGKANPSLKTLYLVATGLGVSVADLFTLAMTQAKGPVTPPVRRVAEPQGGKPRIKKRGK